MEAIFIRAKCSTLQNNWMQLAADFTSHVTVNGSRRSWNLDSGMKFSALLFRTNSQTGKKCWLKIIGRFLLFLWKCIDRWEPSIGGGWNYMQPYPLFRFKLNKINIFVIFINLNPQFQDQKVFFSNFFLTFVWSHLSAADGTTCNFIHFFGLNLLKLTFLYILSI